MIEVNPKRFKFPSWVHQLEGVNRMVTQPILGLFWEMRCGKTKAVIDASCCLMEAREIDTTLIVCPSQVKDVWRDPDLGEIKKHCWLDVHGLNAAYTYHYCARNEDMLEDLYFNYERVFIVTSYEFLRQEDAQGHFPKVRALLKALAKRKVLLAMDEGSVLGSAKSLQVRAMEQLRYAASITRVVEMDGTPAGNSSLSLYSKAHLLDKNILGYHSFNHFKAVHTSSVKVRLPDKKLDDGTVVKRKPFTKVVGFKGLDTITQKMAPYVYRVEQKDVLDMPTKVPGFISAQLSKSTWKLYKQMKDEMIAELDGSKLTVNHAAVKAVRLAQICAGFLGGWAVEGQVETETREISREATDAYLEWLTDRLNEDPSFKTVVWCHWRPEIERLCNLVESRFTIRQLFVGLHYGGRKDPNFLHPDHPYKGAGLMICQPQSAQYGVNFSKASAVTYLSQDYNQVTRSQSEDRVQAPNTRQTTLMMDFLVTGPEGQRTIIHDIIHSLREKEDLAMRTVARWRKALEE